MVLLILQFIAVLICLSCIVLLQFQKNTRQSRLMLFTIICGFIQNFGYLMEMMSQNLGEAMIAVQVEYVGSSFIAFFMTVFVSGYCNRKFKPRFIFIWFAFCCLIFLSVISYKINPLYYTSTAFSQTGLFPHVVLGKGVLYMINALSMYIALIYNCIIASKAYRRSDNARYRNNCRLISISSILPLFVHLVGGLGTWWEGYDPAPIGVSLSITIFAYAIVKQRIFDVVEVAHQNLLTELKDAIVIVDNVHAYMDANKKALELFPALNECSVGEKLKEKQIVELFQNQGDQQIEIGEKTFHVHINEVRNNDYVEGYVAVFFDVTDSIHQFLEMSRLKEEAVSANEAKSVFLANMSHEIRTPLNTIKGLNEVILRDYKEPQLQEYAQNIQSSTVTLMTLINDILDFSKIEAGKIKIQDEKYDVHKFFKNLIGDFQPKIQSKGLKFETDIDPKLPETYYGDAIRIRQIIVNLLTNAIKYTNEGSITLSARCMVIDEQNEQLIVAVRDTGIGIEEEDIPRLFKSFERVEEKRNRSVEGIGLGLNIVKQLLEQMGGELKVFSVYGTGSIFTVMIPQTRQMVSDVDTVRESAHPLTASRAKVLVVDDSKTNLMVVSALLKDTRMQITMVTSGEECLSEIEKQHYDLIFLDHRMPVMDGIETLEEIKKREHLCKDTPIVMLTANAVNDAKADYLRAGFDDFLSKPINLEEMFEIIKKLLKPDLID